LLNKVKAWYRLTEKKVVSVALAHKIVDLIGDPVEYVGKKTDLWNKVDFISQETKAILQTDHDPQSWVKIANFIEKCPNFSFVSCLDDEYPDNLKHIYQKPLFLTAMGDISLLRHDNSISIVGTRKPTQYGRFVTEKIVNSLVMNSFTICSGLALGIDTVAHKKTIELFGSTIAVLAGGLDQIYPPQNLELSNKIKTNGLLISENMPFTPLEKYHFPYRNRIIASLSKAVCIIEGTMQSGAIITAKYGLEYNKEIYALPGDITKKESQGPNMLISKGAKAILTPDDISHDLSIVYKSKPVVKIIDMSDDEKKVYDIIQNNPPDIHLDMLIVLTSMGIGELSEILFMLELKNAIRTTDNNKFSTLS
jgi:DNA processing protein